MKYLLLVVAFVFGLFAHSSQAQFTLQGPGVSASDFEVTTFASGLNFPIGMVEMSDGSVLTAVTNGNSFFANSGSLVRLADTNNDGVADQQTTLASVPFGGLTTVRAAGDLVFTTGQGNGKPIQIYRMGATPSDPFTSLGSITVTYPGGGWLHPHSALEVRQSPTTAGAYELYFQLGSRTNFDTTTAQVQISSTIGVSGSIDGDAIHRIEIMDDGTSLTSPGMTKIATGLRNAAGFDFHPYTGDFYLQDNGIDGLVNANEPHSADELNVIPDGDLGGAVEDFGFPNTYTEYRTDNVIGNSGIQPIAAYQPVGPDDAEGEGPNDITFAPPQFPVGLRNGVFVGMHGKFSLGGLANEENPLIFTDAGDGSYFHFIGNDEPNVGHPNGLLSTQDSLFLADMAPGGGFSGSDSSSGNIYRIKSLVTPGDFDNDGDYSCADIDSLVAEIVAGTNDAAFDVTGDGVVDSTDLLAWRIEAGHAELDSRDAYLPGDANLDGVVDVSDFNSWNANKFAPTTAWCSGDFNADGFVDVTDFNIWNSHKFQSANDQIVPEPSARLLLLLGVLGYSLKRRKACV